MSSFIEVENICKTFRIGKHMIPVLRGANLTVERGEWVALLGASGSGKTTLGGELAKKLTFYHMDIEENNRKFIPVDKFYDPVVDACAAHVQRLIKFFAGR